jgi:hypothetical protein
MGAPVLHVRPCPHGCSNSVSMAELGSTQSALGRRGPRRPPPPIVPPPPTAIPSTTDEYRGPNRFYSSFLALLPPYPGLIWQPLVVVLPPWSFGRRGLRRPQCEFSPPELSHRHTVTTAVRAASDTENHSVSTSHRF